MSLFDKTKNKINNYIGSVESDINSIEEKIGGWKDNFGTGKNLSNLFDQRISDGLSDLISGATGIRTSNIPEIRKDNFKSKNIRSFNGLNMFIYQGQKSFYLWNKINPEVDDELLKLLESKLNR